jgi:hypothetical protein
VLPLLYHTAASDFGFQDTFVTPYTPRSPLNRGDSVHRHLFWAFSRPNNAKDVKTDEYATVTLEHFTSKVGHE